MKTVENELTKLRECMVKALSDGGNKIAEDICDYLCAKSKRLRPVLVFMFSKALGFDIDEKIYHLACAVELTHNSTLVHDDILDNAETRRGNVSLNYKLGNNLSVLAGDILLSVALRELVKCNNIEAIDTFSNAVYVMCKGEVNQNFTIGTVPSMSEYIDKSEYKTAELFKAPLVSLCHITGTAEKDKMFDFARNFGIAFQIKDDLLNILTTDKTKPVLSDIHNGIFTAPVMYLNEDIKNVEDLNETEIADKLLADRKYIDKTVELIKEYAEKAVGALSFIPDNEYKREIIEITRSLYKAGINE